MAQALDEAMNLWLAKAGQREGLANGLPLEAGDQTGQTLLWLHWPVGAEDEEWYLPPHGCPRMAASASVNAR